MKHLRLLLAVQTLYYLITAIWPLFDIESFIWVTGYKTDIWLVKMVGALLIPVSVCMGSYLFIRTDYRPVIMLGGLSTIAFMAIDFYYALNDVIPDIYLVDGVLQLIFLAAWIYVSSTYKAPPPDINS